MVFSKLLSLSVIKKNKPITPIILSQNKPLLLLVQYIKETGTHKVFVAISESVLKQPYINDFFDELKKNSIDYFVFKEFKSDPTIDTVERAYKDYVHNRCYCIVALGGGSVIDAAKLLALKAGNTDKSFKQLSSYTAKTKKSVDLFVVPTTSGTGSEVTLYSVITDKKGRKYPYLTNKYLPRVIVLDPSLTISVPKRVTAYTGIDALTHAIEAYISTFSKHFKKDKSYAPRACKIIFENLYNAYQNPDNIEYRENMQNASYYAGLAFRSISCGYVHAIAHRLGEFYHISHGLANAMVLVYVLEAYLPHINESLSFLSIYCGFGAKTNSQEVNASIFITKTKELIYSLGLTDKIDEPYIKNMSKIVGRVQKEASYTGSPVHLSDRQISEILEKMLK